MVVDHVILDAGAVIACHDLPSLGSHFYSTPVVISEVRDQNAKLRLQLLPEPVQIRDPQNLHIQRVLSMAKASGDIGVLSMADIGIVALALQVMSELGCATVRPAGNDEAVKDADDREDNDEEQMDAGENDGEQDNDNDDDNDDDDDESGWVTKDNLQSLIGNGTVSTEDDAAGATAATRVTVACASTDFAVQNVCAKLGVPILATNGRLITEIRTHVLWCAGCLKKCLRQDRKFCPACGNATLSRVSARLDNATGQLKLYFKANYQYRLKGSRHALPKPRGGKHSLDPVVCEWQRVPQQRAGKKFLQRANPFAVDAFPMGAASMGGQQQQQQQLAFPQHDLSSRAAVLGIKGGAPNWARRNPNESAATRRGHKKRK